MLAQTDEKLFVPIIGIERLRIASDGEGITTLVGLWGCPLRCKYCLNPQSWRDDAGKFRAMTPEMLWEIVRLDNLYFLATGGGVTFGGGEPLLHPDFIRRFSEICDKRWRINLETSLNVPRGNLEKTLPIVHHYIVDVKDTNGDIYHQYTNASNKRTLDNLQWLVGNAGAEKITVRLPLIPHHNTPADVMRSKEIIREMGITDINEFEYWEKVEKLP